MSFVQDSDGNQSEYTVLTNSTRRQALEVLRESRSPMAVADLAAEITAREEGEPIHEIDRERAERMQILLHHNHLPMMDEFGIVEYDPEQRIVAPTDS